MPAIVPHASSALIAAGHPKPDRSYRAVAGTETIARKLGYPLIYLGIDRPRRGDYHMRFELLEAEPANTPEGDISERHTRRLEQDIRSRPAIWLWTHRRWKHRRPTRQV